MAGASFGLDNLVALIDCNGIQADGTVVLDMEPVADKWRAFGWDTQRDRRQRHGRDRRRPARARATAAASRKAIVLRTLPGKGVPTLENAREGAFRPRRAGEWDDLGANWSAKRSSSMAERGRTLAMGEDEKTDTRPRSSTRRSGMRWPRSAATRPDIVGLTADLGKYTDILPFRDAFPDRFFNVGMAEQNLIAVAAGLAAHRPHRLLHDLRRVRDAAAPTTSSPSPARTSASNVKIFAGLPGPDHRLWRHAPGDRGPGADADDPGPRRDRSLRRDRDRAGDASGRRRIDGPVYVRLLRGIVPVVLDPEATASRSAARRCCAKGSDIGIVATGFMTRARARSGRRAGRARHRPSACCTCRRSSRSTPRPSPISPRSVDAARHGREPRRSRAGSPASSPRRCSTAAWSKPLRRIGLPDRFIECGSVPHLQDRYGLATDRVVEVLASLG